MANEILTKRYADALVALSQASGSEIAVKDCRTLLDVLGKVPLFASLLSNRALSGADRLSAVQALVPHLHISDLMERFLKVLAANNRLNLLEPVLQAILQRWSEKQQGRTVTVTVPTALAESARTEMDATVHRLLGRKAPLVYQTESALLGGYQVLDGSTLYDYSKNGMLERLRRHLAA